jgi:hypothetical protein
MKPKNWRRFQHFKDRKPPWIKLYRDILDDLEWHKLDGGAAKFLVQLWLLASEDEEGELPSIAVIAFRFRMTEGQVDGMISQVQAWLEGDDIDMISARYQDDPLETETETEKKHTRVRKSPIYTEGFLKVWKIHPKGPKPKAMEAYARALDITSHDTIVDSLRSYVGKFTSTWTGSHLHRWLEGERWEEGARENPADLAERMDYQRRLMSDG